MDRVRFEAVNPTFLLAVTKTPEADERSRAAKLSNVYCALGRAEWAAGAGQEAILVGDGGVGRAPR